MLAWVLYPNYWGYILSSIVYYILEYLSKSYVLKLICRLCLYETWSWWFSNMRQCHVNLKLHEDTAKSSSNGMLKWRNGRKSVWRQMKWLVSKLDRNTGVCTFRNSWQKGFQQAWIWNWFLRYDSLTLARWSLKLKMGLSIGWKVKMSFKEVMLLYLEQKKSVTFKESC